MDRKEVVEMADYLENGMCRLKMGGGEDGQGLWQDRLVYVLCKAVKYLLTEKLRKKEEH